MSNTKFSLNRATVSDRNRSIPFQGSAFFGRYGLRATSQRCGLAKVLFGKGHRHVTADSLASEAQALQMKVSLATVYNVLNRFAEVGLVRSLVIEGGKTVFDTNTSEHSHFFFEETGDVLDVKLNGMQFVQSLTIPEGYEVANVGIVIRLRRSPCEQEIVLARGESLASSGGPTTINSRD